MRRTNEDTTTEELWDPEQCDHGWRKIGTGFNGVPVGHAKCLRCHTTLPLHDMDRHYYEIHYGYWCGFAG